MPATGYPLLDVFATTLCVALFAFWIVLVFHVLQDLFRSHDLSGGAKARWVLFLFVFPLIGCVLYLLIRGGSMHERQLHSVQGQRQAFEDYIRAVSNTKE